MDTITVRHDRPIPEHAESLPLAKLIASMEVGSSFCVPVKRRKSLQYSIWWHRSKDVNHEKKFITRTMVENEEKVVCCWRVK